MIPVAGQLSFLPLIQALAAAWLMIQPAVAQQQTASEVLQYKGTVVAALEGEVVPFLDGLLVKINFSAGQPVKKGDLLFEFQSRDKELTLAIAQAILKQAEAQLRLAEVNVKNVRTLRTRSGAAERLLETTEAQRQTATAKVEEARATMHLAELAWQQMRLYAPMSGIISRPLVKEGAYITKEAPNQSRLATIAQLDPIHVVGRAPAAMYFQRSGLHESLQHGAEDVEFALMLPTGAKYAHKGHIVAGSFEFDPATQTVEVTLEFPNPDLLLRPGLNVILQSAIRAN